MDNTCDTFHSQNVRTQLKAVAHDSPVAGRRSKEEEEHERKNNRLRNNKVDKSKPGDCM